MCTPAHHGRLSGRSAALSASPSHGAKYAPRHGLLQPHAAPPAATDRRHVQAPARLQQAPHADRRQRPPRPPLRAIRGSIQTSVARCVECATARAAVTTGCAVSGDRPSARAGTCDSATEATCATPPRPPQRPLGALPAPQRPLGALPGASVSSCSWSVECAAWHRAATIRRAASADRASARGSASSKSLRRLGDRPSARWRGI